MNSIYTLLSSEWAETLTTISLRYSIILALALSFLGLSQSLSSSLRALLAFLSITSLGLIIVLQTAFSPISWKILPGQSTQTIITHQASLEPSQTPTSSQLANPTANTPLPSPAIHPLSTLWCLGTLTLLSYWLMAQIRLKKILRYASSPTTNSRLTQQLTALTAKQESPSSIRLYLSSKTQMPFACGIFKPAIVLPSSASDWSDAQLNMVLSHEIAHITRRDILQQSLLNLVLALQWFNPLAWISYRYYLRQREQACDDAVLLAGHTPSTYSQCLLHFVQNIQSPKPLTPISLAMTNTTTISKRLKAILRPQQNRKLTHRRSWLIASLIMLSISIPLGLLQLHAKASPPTPTDVVAKYQSNTPVLNEQQLQLEIIFVEIPETKAVFTQLNQLLSPKRSLTVIESKIFDELKQDAYESVIGSSILMMPTLTTKFNKAAEISVSETLSYPQYTLNEKTVHADTLVDHDYGAKLKIIAQQLPDNTIKIEFTPTVTYFEGFMAIDKKSIKPDYLLGTDHNQQQIKEMLLPLFTTVGKTMSTIIHSSSNAIVARLESNPHMLLSTPIDQAISAKANPQIINKPKNTSDRTNPIFALIRVIPL